MRKSEKRFRHLFEKAEEGILIIRRETIEFANPAIERILGYPIDKITSEPFITFIHPDDRETMRDLHRREKKMWGQAAQKIVDSFNKPFLIDSHQFIVTTSIGIAVYPRDGKDENPLLKNADIAMYQAKQAGRNRYQVVKKEMIDM